VIKASIFKEILDAIDLDNAIIAGGAVRDWLTGRKPKDIDVFYTGNLNFKRLTDLGFTVDHEFDDREIYGNLLGIQTILDHVYKGYKVQFIQINCDPHAFVNTFDLSTSYCWYDFDGFRFAPEFLKSMDTGVIEILKTLNPERSQQRAEKLLAEQSDYFLSVENRVVAQDPFDFGKNAFKDFDFN